jgi:hypothetical protein
MQNNPTWENNMVTMLKFTVLFPQMCHVWKIKFTSKYIQNNKTSPHFDATLNNTDIIFLEKYLSKIIQFFIPCYTVKTININSFWKQSMLVDKLFKYMVN